MRRRKFESVTRMQQIHLKPPRKFSFNPGKSLADNLPSKTMLLWCFADAVKLQFYIKDFRKCAHSARKHNKGLTTKL